MPDLTFGGLRTRVQDATSNHSAHAHELQIVQAYALIQIAQELNEIKNLLTPKELPLTQDQREASKRWADVDIFGKDKNDD